MFVQGSSPRSWLPLFACAVAYYAADAASLAEEKNPMDNGKKVAAIIERMASKNTAPMLQHITDDLRGRPAFPESYDWKEQVRVLTAVVELMNNKSADGWDELFAHFDDSRYCATLALDGEADWGRNFSVGSVCKSTAYSQFKAVLRQPELYLGAYPIAAFGARDLKTWREERKGQSLYQLQIELCELARDHLRSKRVLALYPERAPELDARLELQIEKLSRTKQPVFARNMLLVLYDPLTYMPSEFWPKDNGGSDKIDLPPLDYSEMLPPKPGQVRRKNRSKPRESDTHDEKKSTETKS